MSLPANNSKGLVIRGKRAFHWSHRTVSETGNGTHTLHSKPEENSLWAALYYMHTHITHIQKKQSKPKTNTVLESITAQNNNIGMGEESRLVAALQLQCDNFFLIVTKSLHQAADFTAASPFLTPNSNLLPFSYITISSKQDLVDLCDNQERL